MRSVARSSAASLLGSLLAAAPLAAPSQPAASAPSQPSAAESSLRLHVVSDATGQALPGVSVRIEGEKKLGTVTVAQGWASIRGIPAGWHAILVDMLGYTSMNMSVDFEPGKEMSYEFALAPGRSCCGRWRSRRSCASAGSRTPASTSGARPASARTW
ncbi:MAG: carboxypeptidase-like regulatory domain-containing protein, partial [Gemmatimonadetes bacterium]|nr:carboxypeptidase-like regulatory domain-containing protein [Gemmatimonadota bacterium]